MTVQLGSTLCMSYSSEYLLAMFDKLWQEKRDDNFKRAEFKWKKVSNYRWKKSHFKMESFAISIIAIVEEITSASEAEKDSPFVVKTSQCFALTYFCWPSKLTKISAYYFFSFSRSAHASHSVQSHKLLLFHLESFLNSTKNTISGLEIKRNPRFLISVFFLLKKCLLS